MNISTDILEKLDAGLQRVWKDAENPADMIFPVVIRLHGENSDAAIDLKKDAQAAFLQACFEEETRFLTDRLIRLGGRTVQALWISRAISAQLPGTAILRISGESGVKQIMLDVPRKII